VQVPKQFVDYYEVLELSPRATPDTVERVYRMMLKRFHPDNPVTGDPDRFAAVREAHEVLSNPDRRAGYDMRHGDAQSLGGVFDQETAQTDREKDRRILHAIFSLLYTERRRRPLEGGLGAVALERALGVPERELEFPLWYMKQHGWIEVLDSGQIAITVEGIDKLADKDMSYRQDRMLPESSSGRSSRTEPHAGPRPVKPVTVAV
jgi:curved DNA-binding protein